MRCLIFALFALALGEMVFVNRREIIDIVNSDKTALWTAGIQERFAGMTVEQAKRMVSAQLDYSGIEEESYVQVGDVPVSYDMRKDVPACKYQIVDQGHCGSCWAMSAAAALSDRFCKLSNGSTNVVLSPQTLVSCDWEGNFGCNGGIPRLAWDFMEFVGLPTLSCVPYTSGDGQKGKCVKTCVNGETYTPHRVKWLSAKAYKNEKAIQGAILEGGSVQTGFQVYEDFMSYSKGIYHHVTGSLLGGHAVKIIGWGVENGEKYWIVANSWGVKWGEAGYFRIRRGTNECGFEAGGIAGMPSLK